DEDVGDIRLVSVGRQNQSFNELVGVPFQQVAVFEGARLHLVSVGDYVLGSRSIGGHRSKAPLESGRKTGASAAAQTGILDFLLNFLRRHVAKSFAKRLITAHTLVTFAVESPAIRWDIFGERLLPSHIYLHASRRLSILPGSRFP